MAKIHGQLIRAAVETLGSDPSTTANKFTGRLWYNTATNLVKYTDSSNAVHAFVDADTAQLLTNKSFSDSTTYFKDESDATKIFQFQASGITTGNTRTYTVPDYNGTLATLAGTETFTNKSISGSANTFSNIPVNTLAALTASRVVVTDGSGFISAASTTTTTLGYLDATSSVQTQLDARVAKATLTAKGSIYVATASATIAEQAIGTNDYVLTADSAQTNGLKWAAVPAAPVTALEFTNVGLAVTADAGAHTLAIALKQADGSTDPSTGASALKIGTRSSTATSGAFNTRSVTAASAGVTTLTISSGATLGHVAGVARYIYVYVVDNAGTLEVAVSSKYYDGGSIVSTTAMSNAADVNDTIYSTTARTNVAIRCIGRIKSSQTVAGTWDSAPTEVSVGDSWNDLEKSTITLDAHAGFGSTATKVAYFTNSTVVGTAMSLANDATNGCKITINEPGLYAMMYMARYGASGEEYLGWGLNATVTTGLTSLSTANRLVAAGNVNVAASGNCILCATVTWFLSPGDVLTPHHSIPATPSTTSISTVRIVKVSQNSV